MDYLQIPTGTPELDRHVEHIRNVDWASTRLGPLDQWPQELALMIYQVMVDPFPKLLLLGEDQNMLYNPAYGERIAGEYHPQLLGRTVLEGWAEQQEITKKVQSIVLDTGRPYFQEDFTLFVKRNGVYEENVIRWCTAPLKGPFPGFYVSLDDVTEMRVGEKRRALLKTMSETWSHASDMSGLWSALSTSLESHEHEFPFGLIYAATSFSGTQGTVIDAQDSTRFSLKHFIGTESAQSLVPGILDLVKGNSDSYKEPLRQAIARRDDVLVLDVQSGNLPDAWIRAAKGRGYGDDLTSVAICPIRSNRTGRVVGLLIIGLNTRRHCNEAYQSWISECGRKINDCVTSILLSEEAMRMQHETAKQAAQEQVILARQLASREKEASYANDKAMRLLRTMECGDVGIFEYSPDGKLIQANDSWYKLSGHPRAAEMHTEFSFMDCVYEPDRELVISAWDQLTRKLSSISFEMRWKPKPRPEGEDRPEDGQWVLATCFPVTDENGVLISISGCTTDIGPQKRIARDALARAEALERARESEKEANRANERFQRMTKVIELMDVGVFEYTTEGRLVQANDAYFRISGIDKEAGLVDETAFQDAVYPEDLPYAMEQWESMLTGCTSNFEMRWKAPERAIHGEEDAGRWVLACCIPGTDESGQVTTLFGCITDIDAQKRAETESLRRAEALERARASEQRFVRFTASAAVPIYIIEHPSNTLTYCNDAWFHLTSHPRTEYDEIDWPSVIHQDDMNIVHGLLRDIVEKKETVSVQFRLKRMWTGASGEALSPIWVMATANPEFNEDGSVKSIMGTMSDITGFKFAENVQQLRVDEAIEAKRQQENFIDMTSHEIRNPLGAVVHCADSITDTLSEMQTLVESLSLSEKADTLKTLMELVESSQDAINTITSCSAHQKRIVDDILVLSKLDSNLLQIAPSSVKVLDMLRDVQKMFEAEAQRAEVNITTTADPSIAALDIKYALLDPGRALQILINLVTNAIKFTKNKEKREVTIRMGASKERPSERELSVDFALSHSMRDSIYDMPEFAESTFYIWFTVQDTGRGMSAEEKAKIFSRFTQGSPRTYSEYGGSGLGLFISRELAGLQGGEIGVESEAGVGSTFAFFIKTRHTEALASAGPPLNSTANTTTSDDNDPNLPSSSSRRNGSIKLTRRPASEVTVLVTEDNLLNQKVLKKQLSKHGYKVYTADNGQEALDFVRTTRRWRGGNTTTTTTTTTNNLNLKGEDENQERQINIDVILMDIEMPIMDGLTAAKEIRNHERQSQIQGHIPIIAVSANARAEQTNQAIAVGMDDAISKPFRIVDLIPKIDRLANWAMVAQA